MQYQLDDAICFEFGVHADQFGNRGNDDPERGAMEDVHGCKANLCKSTTGIGLVQHRQVF